MKWGLVGAIFISIFIVFWRGLSLEPSRLPSAQIGKPLPSVSLPLLGHGVKNLQRLPHKVLLVNVFASWCSNCIEEQALLLSLAKQGVLIYGLNYKDSAKEARLWLSKWGNPYEEIFSDKKGLAGIELGVYGAPETFIIDKHGVIQYRYAGALSESVWEQTLKPLFLKLQGAS
jgi:cytochrome c biogenesis protein CcmG/thiol:disulfide interchange protein DsbE